MAKVPRFVHSQSKHKATRKISNCSAQTMAKRTERKILIADCLSGSARKELNDPPTSLVVFKDELGRFVCRKELNASTNFVGGIGKDLLLA